ncbi:MAG: VWA domain-containing protein [Phycisphaerales bacterium]|nr:VWA domain-containing protein [Planctomycetota bacterium]
MSALLAAAIGFPALLALYLLKLRRRPLRVSSVMLWPESATDVQVNVPLARPRASWLLLLHVLLMTLLVAAAGRPALTGFRAGAARIVILIDRSASMSARDGTGSSGEPISRLDEAKERIADSLKRASASGAEVSVAVVSIASRPEIVLGFTSDVGAAAAAARAVRPTDQPGDIVSAFEVARALVSSTTGERESGAEVIVFSDGVFEDDGKELVLPGGAVRLVRVGPAPGAPRQNLGIVRLSARRAENQADVARIFVRIQNTAAREVTVPVRLSVDARTIDIRSVKVPAAGPEGPGETGDEFTLSAPAGGLAMVTLAVDPLSDDLESDNAAATVLRPATPVRLLLVRHSATVRADGPAGDQFSADFLLSDVLEELRPAELIRASPQEYSQLAATDGLKRFDAIVFDGVTPSTPPPVPSLSFGAGLPLPGLRLAASPSDAAPGPVLSWDRSHPLLRDITLDGVVAAAVMTGGEDALAIVRGARGPLVLVEDNELRPRRIVVAFDLVQSNWPLQAGFPIFVKTALDFLTDRGMERAGISFSTVEPVTVQVRGEAPLYAGPVRVQSTLVPGAETARPGEPHLVSLGVLDRAGVYVPEGSGSDPPVAVNLLSAFESAVATSDTLRVGPRAIPTAAPAASPREIWGWLLMAAGGLLVIEWLLFARSARL